MEKTLSGIVPEVLFERMKAHGIADIPELARKVGTSPTCLRRITKGDIEPYTIYGDWREAVNKVAQFFECEPTHLFPGVVPVRKTRSFCQCGGTCLTCAHA